MGEEITEEQAQAILREFQESRQNVHALFRDIIVTKDTTKTGNLTQEELGTPKVPLRTFKQLELFCRKIYQDNDWADWFKELSEINTSTSLSKDAILLKLMVTQKKELADVSPNEKKQMKENKGWFKSKRRGSSEDDL
jgi:hypothetical protein